jgi:AcrR family transcriptional regulator
MGKVKRQPRGTVSRERIAQVALRIADEEGIDALSMRGLAKRLGVGTMTIYGHIEGRDDLLDAIVDCAVSEREPFVSDGDWRQQLRGSVLVVRKGLLRHPSLVELRARRPVLRPEALRFSEHLLGVLRAAGFEPTESAQAFRLLFTYTFGYAAFSPAEATEADRAEARAALAELPRDEYPALAESLQPASEAMGGEAAFEYGLDRILDGLAARLSG